MSSITKGDLSRAFNAFEGLEVVLFSHALSFFGCLFFRRISRVCVGFSLFSLQPTVMKFSVDTGHIAIHELSNQDVAKSNWLACHETSLG